MNNQAPFFMKVCWRLNALKLSYLSAFFRWIAFKGLGHRVFLYLYSSPDNVHYLGWYEANRLGVLAFKQLDGSLQFRW